MIREAGPEDRAALEALLLRRIEGAMFPLSNLRAHGLGRGDFATADFRASRFWLVDGQGVVGVNRRGMLMALLEDDADLSGLRAALAGCLVTGAVGPVASVRQVLVALGLEAVPKRLDRDEPGFSLELTKLRVPDRTGARLVPASDALRDVLIAWRAEYQSEVLGTVGAEAEERAAEDIAGFNAEGSHRVLLVEAEPVAMTGFNARLPEIVQVGGVYTPTALRGRGYARLAVALHLAEARDAGVGRAVLFAASDAAARAYLGIGFRPSLEFALVLLTDPATVTPCP
jgi:RimJ/RimL family protein N-acetyltransferase